MSEITEMIDKVASSLEGQGLIKEAMELDVLSNTIEAYEKEAWTSRNSPQYALLGNVLRALEKNSIQNAMGFMSQGKRNKDLLLQSYGNFQADDGSSPAQTYGTAYEDAMKALENNNQRGALVSTQVAMKALDKLEPIITQKQKSNFGQQPVQPQQTPVKPPQEMIFTNKSPSGPAPKRAPLPNPGRRE